MMPLQGSDFLYYSMQKDAGNCAGFDIEFDHELDGETLQKAVQRALVQQPYFANKLVLCGEEYMLEKNDLPVQIYPVNKDVFPMFGPNNNYYMFRFSIEKNRMECRFSHALSDGRGFYQFLKIVLPEYFSQKYNQPYGVNNADFTDTPAIEDAVCFPKIPQEQPRAEEKQAPDMYQPHVFQVPDEADPDHKCYKTVIEFDADEFIAFSKGSDGSPSATMALLMSKAVLSVHPEASDRIYACVAIDPRPALNAEASPCNLAIIQALHYDKRMEQYPFDLQSTCYRGALLLKADTSSVLSVLNRIQQLNDMVVGQPTFKAKQAVAMGGFQAGVKIGTFMFSYVGRMDFGDIDRHVKSVTMWTDRNQGAIRMELNCTREKFFLTFMQEFENDRYINAFLQQLEQQHINYRRNETTVMQTCLVECPV